MDVQKKLVWFWPSRGLTTNSPLGSTETYPANARVLTAQLCHLSRAARRPRWGKQRVPGSLRGFHRPSQLFVPYQRLKMQADKEPKLRFGVDLLSPTSKVQIEYICFQTV